MRRVANFAQILDETLAAAVPPLTERVRPGVTPPHVLGFFDFRTPGRQPFAIPRVPAFALPSAPRLLRRLTAAQQRALRDLVDLGANIRSDFTIAELRAAFRALARDYHPDRFPHSSESEKAQLSRSFARAHHAYRLLKSAAPVAA